MKKVSVVKAIDEFGPDLLVSPHILPQLMELFVGDRQQALSQQKQLITHITDCHYCRTAVMVLLSYAQEYDSRYNPEEPAHDLLERFAAISRKIEAREAREFERLAVYAETIAKEGLENAAQRFPEIAAHLKICSDCRSAVEKTVASLTREEKTN